MSAPEHTDPDGQTSGDYEAADARADAIVIGIMFVTLVLFAVHFASGWTFDF